MCKIKRRLKYAIFETPCNANNQTLYLYIWTDLTSWVLSMTLILVSNYKCTYCNILYTYALFYTLYFISSSLLSVRTERFNNAYRSLVHFLIKILIKHPYICRVNDYTTAVNKKEELTGKDRAEILETIWFSETFARKSNVWRYTKIVEWCRIFAWYKPIRCCRK